MRAVLFDAVGTLLVPEPEVGLAYADAGRAQGVVFAPDEIRRRFRGAFSAEEARDRAAGDGRTSPQRERARWRSIVGQVFHEAPGDVFEPILERLWEHFARPENWRLVAGVAAVFEALESRGLTLGVASNFDERLHRVLAGHPPLDRCGRVFVSAELGYRKPAAGFFRAIESRLGLAADDLVLVGDDVVNDYQGAVQAGWRAVLVEGGREHLQLDRVATLAELVGRFPEVR